MSVFLLIVRKINYYIKKNKKDARHTEITIEVFRTVCICSHFSNYKHVQKKFRSNNINKF